ncbi:hypothetical protein LOD99_14851 [Oopsacas minuta]|uniref:ZFYVE26-like TPR repeats domain-containing protein n=1 Tax=Oopsacas minuta TaxID=111878 RepID=A0AAV7KD45_9METZ|nr:hypothetical protein LOD99_14851 [Oopsacas minuta]
MGKSCLICEKLLVYSCLCLSTTLLPFIIITGFVLAILLFSDQSNGNFVLSGIATCFLLILSVCSCQFFVCCLYLQCRQPLWRKKEQEEDQHQQQAYDEDEHAFINPQAHHEQGIGSFPTRTPPPSYNAISAGDRARIIPTYNQVPASEVVKQESKPIADLNAYLENIKLQIEVTQFFHLCQNKNLFASNLKLGKQPLTQTPTLFGSPALKTKLAAEIIVAGNTVSLGIELMLQVIKTFRLVASEVFSEAITSLLLAKRSDDLKETIRYYSKCYKVTDIERDQVVINAIREVPVGILDPEMVVSLLICDKSKVELNIQFGRLRNAYLAAVKTNMIEEVKRIRQLAIEKGDSAIKEICERYLLQYAHKK